jgi:Glutamine amidotransferase class-I/SAP domain
MCVLMEYQSRRIFKGLPDSFEVARYHSLHGIRERLPSCLEVTALTSDGIVMGIQHKTLPFAAVQFHPESILTSPAHGLAILKNALSHLKYGHDDDYASPSGAEIVGELEKMSTDELKAMLKNMGMSSTGSKSDVVVRLALWKHKSAEAKAGRISLSSMTEEELLELRQGLGLKGTASTKEEQIQLLKACLLEAATT